MSHEIKYLQNKYPKAVVYKSSVDKDFICVRHTCGASNFGKNDKGEQVTVPITDTEKYHIDSIRLRVLIEASL